ncbi:MULTISPECIES: SLBB domain-containing protein [unclassified Colwellia]|uniref:SLBB domain-containing protein n=1 Tax=unclassified Colwellia TaxID=196834 RepID=UPI0015F4A0CF|nr:MULTISPECIES: SLBB domain-containing protein [unclassified Colwellia]MBA6233473.1 SLBB domain-containing protein [Colwellia sp. MB02u-7]MBA6236563.1 SLBB domain-containing protein [Colwellia sp. MB02u-11]MBA6298038.1 SLBB domain-containing protein [Colwellia sp. MB3u-22]MBA6312138.1 SLBB domain-containing protein [Colwellia sp. MB3u-64]
MMNIIRYVIAASLLFTLSFNLYAQQVSAQQIEQFKKLPKSQQQVLAKSMGVNLSAIEAQLAGKNTQQGPVNTPIIPRALNGDNTINQNEDESDEQKNADNLFKKLPRFGLDVFANAPSTFSPVMDIAIPEGYILGTGDSVSVQVFGKENREMNLTVSREGELVFPTFGPIKVAGLTFSELKKFVVNKVKQKIIGVDVVVSLTELRSMRVLVMGAAYKPGPYTLSSLSSVTHAIFAAGGISDIGSLRNIEVKRGGKLIQKVDLYELLIEGDSSSDILLQSGDVVLIPAQGPSASIFGEVRRPAIYELAEKDNFDSVIAMAGGLLPSAYPKSATVERYNSSNLRSIINIDLSNKNESAKAVEPGDYIRILKSSDMYGQSITLIGAVARPGKYQWHKQQQLSDVIRNADSYLLPYADLNYGIIVREIDSARNIEILQFNLAEVFADNNSINNIQLNTNDKIIVFSSAITLSDEQFLLDELAYTQEELLAKERNLVIKSDKRKKFWNKYGKDSLVANSANEEVQQSINDISGGVTKNIVNVREMALFSRQRLLVPIVNKLRQQAGAGTPIQLVEVDGEVKFPGVYPLGKYSRVNDLIRAAGGVKESAYLSRAELTRNEMDGMSAVKISKNIQLANALQQVDEDNIILKSKDRLNVHRIPAWSENNVIELRGEVLFPGKYTVRRGDKLSSVIKKAGGLTSFADPNGSVFSRVKLKQLEKQNLIKVSADLRIEMATKSLSSNSAVTSYTEIQSLLADLTKVEPVGRLVINLPRVIASNDYDVAVEGGDILYIPTMKDSVNVMGQVQVNSSHMFDSSRSVEQYIAQSGGLKKRADDERIYIISSNGSIRMLQESNWFAGTSDSALKPGDSIVVPLDSEYMNSLTLWTTATTIMYNTAVAVAAISGL